MENNYNTVGAITLVFFILFVASILSAASAQADDRYVITFGLKQSRISLDIWEHAKDSANSTEFQIPVDKQFYDSVDVGTEITDELRTGSLVLHGSFSSWKIWVKAKDKI